MLEVSALDEAVVKVIEASASSLVDFKTVSKTADQKPSSTIDDPSFSFKENVKTLRNISKYSVPKAASVPAGSRNRPTYVPANSRNRPTSVPTGSRNRPTSVPAGLAIITNCIWMREDGELLLSPQQVVLGEFKGQLCNGDPRTMVDLINLHGGTVTFGGGDGKITGKGTIRISKLNFENVYYVEELQNFNLFSVSQICDVSLNLLSRTRKLGHSTMELRSLIS
ncbi:hypothetical protein Tco_0869494 [Tanacetum coccineum]